MPHILPLVALLSAGCESGKRPHPVFPDSTISPDLATPIDRGTVERDLAMLPDQRADKEAPRLDHGLTAMDGEADAEAEADAAVQPDSAACPTPPFGSSVGISAANFSIPDCGTDLFELHAQCGKYPAVVLLYSYTSFT